jgi:peroxiredoxin
LDSVVATTMELQTKLESQRQSGGDVVELQKQWQQQQLKEREESIRLLGTNQQRAWLKLNGEPVDLAKAQRIYPMAPDFAKSSTWLGKSPGSIGDLKGKVVVIHFYAFQCINCQRNFHHYNSWNQQWAGQDVVVVGIQTPETTAESDILLVGQALEKDKFEFPVIMDSDKANWKAWGNTMWPTVYVVDKRGYIRMWWQGELNWQGATGDQRVTEMVKQLLEE